MIKMLENHQIKQFRNTRDFMFGNMFATFLNSSSKYILPNFTFTIFFAICNVNGFGRPFRNVEKCFKNAIKEHLIHEKSTTIWFHNSWSIRIVLKNLEQRRNLMLLGFYLVITEEIFWIISFVFQNVTMEKMRYLSSCSMSVWICWTSHIGSLIGWNKM